MTVLVTGAAGFFGSALVRSLALAGRDVMAVDRVPETAAQRRPDVPAGLVRYLVADLTDPGSLARLRGEEVTAIVHAAALSLPDEPRYAQATVDVNVRGTLALLELAAALPRCDRFLLVSSAGVYDLERPGTITETDATGGGSLYGATKLASELLARRLGATHGFDVGIVRPSSLWGPGEVLRPTRPFVTPLQELVAAARAGEPVEARGLDAGWDWLYVDDAAEGVERFLASAMGGRALTLASGRTTAFREVVDGVAAVFGLRIAPGGRVVGCSPDRPARLSTAALAGAIGWQPHTSLLDGLRRYRDFLDASDQLPAPAAPPALSR